MTNYEASSIKVLEGLDAVRTRPGMYIGSTGSEGLSHLLWEMIDNAVDEMAEGHGNEIEVVLHGDTSYEVIDNGRGIPVDAHSDGRSALEVIFTELHAGGKFGSSQYKASGGLHGVGASVVNALSTRVDVEVKRNGKIHSLSFNRGLAGHFDEEGEFSESSVVRVSGSVPKKQTGTRIRYWPDSEFLSSTVTGVSAESVVSRMKQICYLIPGLRITITDSRGDHCHVQKLGPSTGLEECIADLGREVSENLKWVGPTITVSGTGTYDEKVPVDGEMRIINRACEVHAVLRWGEFQDSKILTWVNTIPTPDGGTHYEGFQKALTSVIRAALKEANLKKLRKAETGPGREDCLMGLVAALRVLVPEPQFRGQTKRQLGTVDVEQITIDTIKVELGDWFNGKHKSATAANTRAVLNWVADTILAREAAAKAAATKRRSRKLSTATLPAKLADCHVHNTDNTKNWVHPAPELLIVEGDSAAGPAKRARDSRWQAVLPLRGKIINASKATVSKVLQNAEVAALISAVGAGSGQNFTIDDSRYERIVLLADADVDGNHIRCLMLTFLWKYMKPLLEAGKVYAAQPPTHAIIISGEKQFVYSENELAEATFALDKANRKYTLTRFKGLGEMNDNELLETALNPNTRLLRKIAVHDAERAVENFEVMMGDDIETRRQFISEHSSAYGHSLDI